MTLVNSLLGGPFAPSAYQGKVQSQTNGFGSQAPRQAPVTLELAAVPLNFVVQKQLETTAQVLTGFVIDHPPDTGIVVKLRSNTTRENSPRQ